MSGPNSRTSCLSPKTICFNLVITFNSISNTSPFHWMWVCLVFDKFALDKKQYEKGIVNLAFKNVQIFWNPLKPLCVFLFCNFLLVDCVVLLCHIPHQLAVCAVLPRHDLLPLADCFFPLLQVPLEYRNSNLDLDLDWERFSELETSVTTIMNTETAI